jgi:hypothetical protein
VQRWRLCNFSFGGSRIGYREGAEELEQKGELEKKGAVLF